MKAALLFLMVLAGCSWAQASPSEYAAYRKTRVEPSLDARMAAAHDYLIAYPEGAYAAEVRRRFARNEPLYFESRQRSEQGLEAYLKAMPQGPHAAEVRARLSLIAERKGKPDQLSAAASETEAKLSAAARTRDRARDELTFWLQNLGDKEAYAAPLSEGPADLVVAFSLSLPPPLCHAEPPALRVCVKELVLPFMIPGAPGSSGSSDMIERQLAFSITIVQDSVGRPQWARIEGKELFSRLDETQSLQVLAPEELERRAAAIASAADQVSGEAAPSCRKEPTPPEVLRLECNGLRVIALAGDPGTPDAVIFEPL